MASYNTSNAALHMVRVNSLPFLLSYPSVACAHASHTEFLTIASGVPSKKYESTIAMSARNFSSCKSFFFPSNFKTQYVVISLPVPNVVGIRIFGIFNSDAEYFATSWELPPPSPIIAERFLVLYSEITF